MLFLSNAPVFKLRARMEGAVDAKGNHDSDDCVSSGWSGDGTLAHLCSGYNHITSSDGECGHREKDKPTLCKMSFCAACAECLWEEIQRGPEEIGKM
jgi:hypothetical protein